MTYISSSKLRSDFFAVLATLALTSAASAQEAKIIQPGAPGKASKEISAEEASDLAGIL